MIKYIGFTLALIGLAAGSDVGVEPRACNLLTKGATQIDSRISPNGIFTALLEMERSRAEGRSPDLGDSDISRAMRQAGELEGGLRESLKTSAPLVHHFIDTLSKNLAKNVAENRDCDRECKENLYQYYYVNRPNDLHAHVAHQLGSNKASTLFESLSGKPDAPKLTMDLIDEAYNEFVDHFHGRSDGEKLDLSKFVRYEEDIAYQTQPGARVLDSLKRLYRANCRNNSADFIDAFQTRANDLAQN